MHQSRPHLFGMLAGLFLAVGLVLAAMVTTTTWLKVKNSRFINVKGLAHRDVRSDLVIWRGSFTTQAETLLAAQQQLKADAGKVAEFLQGRSITNFTFAPIAIEEMSATKKDPATGYTESVRAGYRLTQTVRVESADVDRIAQLDRETTVLVADGVVFTTMPPDYIYTKAGEAKIEMLAEATKDARARAEQIASQGDVRIDRLNSADQGVFQITPLHDMETSWSGVNDTSSLDKTITAVVTATFLLK